MAIIRYSVRVADPLGSSLIEIGQFPRLSYVLSAGQIGVLELVVGAEVDPALFRLDGRIGVWRSINGRPPVLDGDAIYLIRAWQYDEHSTTITALHATSILQSRIINYYAGSSYSDKSATAADDLIKALARENLGSSISAANRIGDDTGADLSSYLSIQSNVSAAPSIAKAVAWQNLYDAVQGICSASTQAGTWLCAEIVAPTESTLELRTYTGQRGQDHRATSGNPVILSPGFWNLQQAQLVVDHREEVTFATVGGKGERDTRATGSAFSASRLSASPFNRRERFGEDTQTLDAAILTDDADGLVRAGVPRITFAGELVDTDGTTRGIHYDYGDYVTAMFRGQQYDVRINVVSTTVEPGRVTQQVQLRYDNESA
jgi:Siphovirus ReqiPepy6 Gp37-like protein